MEAFLMERLSVVSEEEKRLLQGGKLDPKRYPEHGDLVIDSKTLLGKEREVWIRTNVRFVAFPPHRHNGMEIMIVLSGKITHHIGDRILSLHKGDILVLNRHAVHSLDRADFSDVGVNLFLSDSFIHTLNAELSETVFSELLNEHNDPGGAGVYLCFSAHGDKQVENIIENTLYELTEYRQSRQVLAHSVGLLFHYLSLKKDKMLREGSRLPNRNMLRKSAVTDYIRCHCSDGTLRELAAMLYLSEPYLSGQISKLFHKSFKELLTEERLRQAEELIKNTKMPIGEIIRSVGYENASFFHRAFKKRYGITPLSLRKSSILKFQ